MVDFHSFVIAAALTFSVASATNSTEFVCPSPDGQFADALNCSAYYNCWDGAWTRQHCQAGLYFDAKVGYCNWKSAVQCNVTTVSDTNSPNKTRGSRVRPPRVNSTVSTIATESPINAVTFSTDPTPFVEGAKATTPGEITTHLNETAQAHSVKQVRSSNARLGNLMVPGYQGSSLQPSLYPSPCRAPSGQFVDPKNCSFYYNCWKGDWIHVQCPDGLYFDDVRKYCNWRTQVNCAGSAAPSGTPSPTAIPSPSGNGYGNAGTLGNGYGGQPASVTTTTAVPSVTVTPSYGYQTTGPTATITSNPLPVSSVSTNPEVYNTVVPAAPGYGGSSPSTLPPAVTYSSTVDQGTFTGTYPPPLYTTVAPSAPGYAGGSPAAGANETPSSAPPAYTTPITTNYGGYPAPIATTMATMVPSTADYGTTSALPVATSPYIPMVQYGQNGGNEGVAGVPVDVTNPSSTSTVNSLSSITTTAPLNTQTTTPLVFNEFSTFSPFNGFSALPTLFPWANGDGNDLGTTESSALGSSATVSSYPVDETTPSLNGNPVYGSNGIDTTYSVPSTSGLGVTTPSGYGNGAGGVTGTTSFPTTTNTLPISDNGYGIVPTAGFPSTNIPSQASEVPGSGYGGNTQGTTAAATTLYSDWTTHTAPYVQTSNPGVGYGGASSNLALGLPPYGNVFNNLTYPSSAAAAPDEHVANEPSQTTETLRHAESGTVVYVTNNILTTITVANRTLNATNGAPLGYLKLQPVIMKEGSASYKCPQPYGLFPDPKDCSAYMNCWRGSWTRQYCKGGSVFDQDRHSCTESWDTPTGCKMIRPDSPTPSHNVGAKVDTNELEKEEPRIFPSSPSAPGRGLFSPQNVGAPKTATLSPPTPTFVYDHPDLVQNQKVLQPGPRASMRPFFVKRSASNELEDEEFVCPETEGLFQHETDCSAFWNCGDNVGYLQNCPKPLMFDVKAQRCEWFRGAHCVGGSIIQSPNHHHNPATEAPPVPKNQSSVPTSSRPNSPSFFKCPSKQGVFEHPFDCVKYYHCHDWKPMVRSCDNGKLFSKSHGRCENSHRVSCPTGSGSPAGRPNFQCPLRTGYFADPSNCRRFFQCVNNFAYHLTCPGNLMYNPLIKVCDWPAYVTCSGGEPAAPSEVPRPAKDFKCPKPNGKFNHPRVDGSFYECVNGSTFLKNCPNDHTFIANLRLCMPNHLLATAAPEATSVQTTTNTPTTADAVTPIISTTSSTSDTSTILPTTTLPVASTTDVSSTSTSVTAVGPGNQTEATKPSVVIITDLPVSSTVSSDVTSTAASVTEPTTTITSDNITSTVGSTSLVPVTVVTETETSSTVASTSSVPTPNATNSTPTEIPSTTSVPSTTLVTIEVTNSSVNETETTTVIPSTTLIPVVVVTNSSVTDTTAISSTTTVPSTTVVLVVEVTNSSVTEAETTTALQSTTQLPIIEVTNSSVAEVQTTAATSSTTLIPIVVVTNSSVTETVSVTDVSSSTAIPSTTSIPVVAVTNHTVIKDPSTTTLANTTLTPVVVVTNSTVTDIVPTDIIPSTTPVPVIVITNFTVTETTTASTTSSPSSSSTADFTTDSSVTVAPTTVTTASVQDVTTTDSSNGTAILSTTLVPLKVTTGSSTADVTEVTIETTSDDTTPTSVPSTSAATTTAIPSVTNVTDISTTELPNTPLIVTTETYNVTEASANVTSPATTSSSATDTTAIPTEPTTSQTVTTPALLINETSTTSVPATSVSTTTPEPVTVLVVISVNETTPIPDINVTTDNGSSSETPVTATTAVPTVEVILEQTSSVSPDVTPSSTVPLQSSSTEVSSPQPVEPEDPASFPSKKDISGENSTLSPTTFSGSSTEGTVTDVSSPSSSVSPVSVTQSSSETIANSTAGIFVSGSAATEDSFSWTLPPDTVEDNSNSTTNATDSEVLSSTEFPDSVNSTATDLLPADNSTAIEGSGEGDAFLEKLYRKVRDVVVAIPKYRLIDELD